MPSLIRFFFRSAALPLGTANAADEATKAVELRKVRRLSRINPLQFRDASHVSGNGLPAAIAFEEHIRETATTDSVLRTIRFIDDSWVQVINEKSPSSMLGFSSSQRKSALVNRASWSIFTPRISDTGRRRPAGWTR